MKYELRLKHMFVLLMMISIFLFVLSHTSLAPSYVQSESAHSVADKLLGSALRGEVQRQARELQQAEVQLSSALHEQERREFEEKSVFDWSVQSSRRRVSRRELRRASGATRAGDVLACISCRRLAALALEAVLRKRQNVDLICGDDPDSWALPPSAPFQPFREACVPTLELIFANIPEDVRRAAELSGNADDLSAEHVSRVLALCHAPLNLCRREDPAPRFVFSSALDGDHAEGQVHFDGKSAPMFQIDDLLLPDIARAVTVRNALASRSSDATAALIDEYPPVLHVVWLNDPAHPYTAAHYAALCSAITAFKPVRTYLYYDSIPQDTNNKVNRWFTKASSVAELVRVSPVRAIGDAAVRHVTHCARLLGLIALRAVGGTLIDSDLMMLRDFDTEPRTVGSPDFARDVTILRMPAHPDDDALLPRVDLGIVRAQAKARWLDRLLEEAAANFHTLTWDAHFNAAASVLVELYSDNVRVVDARPYDFGADMHGDPTNQFWNVLESTGEQFDNVGALRLRQEEILELGMTLPEWAREPGARGDVVTSLLCELRPYKNGLTELEDIWHRGRWAFRSRRYEEAVALLERYLYDAEPGHGAFHATAAKENRTCTDPSEVELPSQVLSSRPDRERAWARLLLAKSALALGNVPDALHHMGEATEHHGLTMREVWFHAKVMYDELAENREAQRFGLEGESRIAAQALSSIGDIWDISDCFRDAQGSKK